MSETGAACTEETIVNPLTAYARSKAAAERDLAELAEGDFRVTCLRFGTACGMSDRLRLDLVLNDFIASAIATNRITVLSDGTPWRPLIHVNDMARAIDWAIGRGEGQDFHVVNVGRADWNFTIRELAEAVAARIHGTSIDIGRPAAPDKRSYQVNFDLFKRIAPNHQPIMDLDSTIQGLVEGLRSIGFSDANFRQSRYMRLNALGELRSEGLLTDELFWQVQET